MTLASKQRVVAAALAALALWPPVHYGLVSHYDLTPWRFFGWAMYCTPKLPVRVSIEAVSDGGRVAVSGSEDRTMRRALRRFAKRRRVWGRLEAPDALAALALAAHPESDAAEVTVERLFLDPTTARIGSERETYVYRR